MALLRLTPYYMLLATASIFYMILTMNRSEGAKATEHAYIDHIVCTFNPEFTTNTSCKLKFVNRLQKSFSSTCFVKKPLDVIIGQSQLYHKFTSGYKIFLVDTTINLCDFLDGKIGSQLIELVLRTLRKHIQSNQELKCPYYGVFNINDFRLNGELFDNHFIPVGDYMVNITASTIKRELIWNGKFYFTIPSGKTIEDDQMGR